MKTVMLGLLAETPIHCGAGASAGIVDLPVAREAATDYPFIAGSGLKGALRDRFGQGAVADELFGKPDCAGQLLVSDARLLLLPVRSLTGAYRWVTCRLLLERYGRDRKRCALSGDVPSITVPRSSDGTAGVLTANGPSTNANLASGAVNKLYLEEREFVVTGTWPAAVDVVALISPLIRHQETKRRLAEQVVIVSDDDFSWFCRFSLPVQARNVLDIDGSKRTKNLWYEESLPPDTVLYALGMGRDESARDVLSTSFPENDPYLQIGGNETVGNGWVVVSVVQ